MSTRLFPNERYIPIECINSDGSLRYIRYTGDTNYKEYSYVHLNSIRDLKDHIANNIELSKTGIVFLTKRTGCIRLKNTIVMDNTHRIAIIAVIKTEDFNNGVDYTNPNNWYYMFNYGTNLSDSTLDSIRKGLNIPIKRMIGLTGDLYNTMFQFKATMREALPQSRQETLKNFIDNYRQMNPIQDPVEELCF